MILVGEMSLGSNISLGLIVFLFGQMTATFHYNVLFLQPNATCQRQIPGSLLYHLSLAKINHRVSCLVEWKVAT